MSETTLEELRTALAELGRRVAVLETAVPPPSTPSAPNDVAPGEIDFRLMERLQGRKGEMFDKDGVGGSIVYAGDFRNGQGSGAWHVERPIPFLASYAAEPLAHLLAALSHPQRLSVVQLLLRGPHDRQQLQEALGSGSVGQLYHHLHSLLEAGVVVQERRGVYAVSRKATIPLLVIMAAAVDMTENKQQAIQESDE